MAFLRQGPHHRRLQGDLASDAARGPSAVGRIGCALVRATGGIRQMADAGRGDRA
jgi:hypothetical protein